MKVTKKLAAGMATAALTLPLTIAPKAEAAPTATITAAPIAAKAKPRKPRLSASYKRALLARKRAVQAARSALGKPYVYGARGPRSFDCSGLTQWSLSKAGKRIPRTSQAQARAGRAVRRARAGDVILYSSGGAVTHVGIVAKVSAAGRVLLTVVAPHSGAVVKVQAPYRAYRVVAFLP